jgi:DtxR family transcriptional regulator, Mn-dependent transcriptional regulator
LALRMVRRHRLVETFLHSTLRVPLERVHDEAERIEHVISDDVSTRLARFLDNPVADPHGHRIPDGFTKQKKAAEVALLATMVGAEIVITSIDDRDAQAVRKLASLGVLPGMRAVVSGNDGERVQLRVGRRKLAISTTTLRGVRCMPI